MIEIAGYSQLQLIKETNNSLIYVGTKNSTNKNVLLKVLNKEYPTSDNLNSFKEEYNLLHDLDIQGVPKAFDLLEYNNSLIIIQEYIPGNTLENLIQNKKLSINEFLPLALQLTTIIEEIHHANVIHKDINCTNIVLSKKNVYIVDFGVATKYTRETPSIDNFNTLQGTLPYISPEQTGRMNRSLDYRTDFYSLGITFYRMLTGEYPFECADTSEWVHAHIAKKPSLLHDKGIPPLLSDIIHKLLEKNAEDRYQSARGIQEDLLFFKNNQSNTTALKNYKPGCKDFSNKLSIPEKLYGRENELSQLLNIYTEITGGSKKMLLCAGEPGIGKSALIKEFHKSITGYTSFFISGKYNKLKQNVTIPYSAIIQALHELTKKILSESNENLEKWKNKILNKIGSNGRVICEVIPELELIIGPQPEVEKLPPTETQNRFNLVFQNFMTVFAQKKHPLIIFLDDLQWADNASFQFIETILEDPELKHFLLIGAYRNNEVDETHYLFNIIYDLNQYGLDIDTIFLESLSCKTIIDILNDTFYKSEIDTQEFSSIIKRKTGGNPFFVKEFLKTLFQNNIIDLKNNSWIWDIKSINEMEITENVVQFMAAKLNILPNNCLKVIKIGASIGTRFSIDLVSHINQIDKHTLLKYLKPALDAGMIILLEKEAQFVHDRIMEAARLLTSEEERTNLHYAIGMKLLEDTQNIEENIFEITNQLNQAVAKLSKNEKKYLLELTIKAALKAKKSTAFEASNEFFEKASILFPHNNWKINYEKSISFYTEWAETAYMALNFKKFEKIFEIVLKNAINLVDRIKIYEIKIVYLIKQVKFKEASDIGIKVLNEIGLYFPPLDTITNEMSQNKLRAFEKTIQDKNINTLLQFEKISNKNIEMAIGILNSISIAVWNSYPEALIFELVTICELSFEYGFSPASLGGIAFLSAVITIVKKIDLAYKLSLFALKGLKKFDDNFFIPMIYFCLYSTVYIWKYPLNQGLKKLLEGAYEGSQAGNNQWAAYCINYYCMRRLWIGENLKTVQKIFESTYFFQYKITHEDSILFFNIPRQIIAKLLETEISNKEISGKYFDAQVIVPKMIEIKFYPGMGMYYSWSLFLYCILGYYDKAFEIAKEDDAVPFISTNLVNFESNLGLFFYGIALLKKYNKLNNQDKSIYIEKIKNIIEKVKTWSELYEHNFKFFELVLSAEYARITNKNWKAITLYKESIKFAAHIGLIQGQALANEFAAHFWEEQNNPIFAEKHIYEAYYRYGLWGAKAKTALLEKQYPFLTENNQSYNFNKTITTTLTGDIDINGIMKISQSLSEEKDYDKLLSLIPRKIKQIISAEIVTLSFENPNDRKEIFINENKTQISLPLKNQGKISAILHIDNTKNNKILSDKEIETINLLSSQIAISLDNARLYSKLSDMVSLRTKRIETVATASEKLNLILENKEIQNQFISQIKDQFGYSSVNIYTIEDFGTKSTMLPIIEHVLEIKKVVTINSEDSGLASEMAVPIISETQLLGVLHVKSSINTQFEDGDEHLLLSLANHMAIALTNKKLFNSLESRAKELSSAKKMAEKANKAKSDFLSNMSHELRTPLNAILGYAQILERNNSITGLQKEGLNIIHKSGEHLLTLITDILDLSKIEAGKFELLNKDFDLQTFLNNIEGIIKVKAEHKKIDFSLETTNLPRGIHWDEKRLGQILINLLSNAIKFTDKGSVILDVSLIEEEGTLENPLYKILFKVVDSGIGMNESEIKKIFDPFEQVGDIKRRVEGTGLGLAITHRLISMMKSSLEIESEINRGSTFSFKLDIPGAVSFFNDSNSAIRKIVGYKGKKQTVLVVDDNTYNREILHNILHELGFNVIHGVNGKEGVELAKKHQPHFIMMDMVMPIMTGFEAIKILKNDPKTKNIYIISISASVFAEDISAIEYAGSNYFLSKPIDMNELFALLKDKLSYKWIYSTPEKPILIPDNNKIVPPDEKQLNSILELAKSGRLKKIKNKLKTLVQQNNKYEAFSIIIEKYIKNYDDESIIQFIQNLSTTYPQDVGNK